MMQEKRIYRLNDEISFRRCSLADASDVSYGDCTNFNEFEYNYKTFYECNQKGIHFHCTKHPEIEFDIIKEEYGDWKFKCPKCKKEIEIGSFKELINQSLRMLNIEEFKDAQLIRLDDWYVREVKKKESTQSDYWINTEVKTDKDGDTIVVIYIGHKGDKEKVQFFVKPEKMQLTSDHKDLDPAKILSKIEVTLKDRSIIQKYD